MNILVVDDDDYKRGRIVEFLQTVVEEPRIDESRSLQSGLKSVLDNKYDFIVLDMTMPTFDITDEEDGGRPQAYAGREILRNMKRRRISTPAVVITQFDIFGDGRNVSTLEELDQELQLINSGSYMGTIYYNVGCEDWKEDLEKIIVRINGNSNT